MPALTTLRSRILAGCVAAAFVMAAGSPAFADNKIGGGAQAPAPTTDAHGDSDGAGTLSATAGAVVFDRSRNGSGPAAGPVTSTSTWTPPACYYAPKYTPEQLQKYLEAIWGAESTGYEWEQGQRKKYVDGSPYKDFNKDKAGQGYWWDSYVTPGREGDPHALDCDKDIFWVDKGADPPADAPQAINARMLAELAYAEIRVPPTKVELAPAGQTKVNLPTWAWLDGATFKPVSVTASVPLLGISATTTAEPRAVQIDPGTPDAETYPADGVCQVVSGRVGEPYARGKAEQEPPCGVKYLRSSGTGSYPLKATVTWHIHWTGTNAPGGDLPDGEFGATQQVVVQEIQAVNR